MPASIQGLKSDQVRWYSEKEGSRRIAAELPIINEQIDEGASAKMPRFVIQFADIPPWAAKQEDGWTASQLVD